MARLTALIATQLCLFSLAQASPIYSRASEIQWQNCTEQLNITTILPITCGNLSVPLDYSDNSSQETFDLQLYKVDALKKPSKGSIIVNFGGPGINGKDGLATNGLIVQAMTGGQFDIVSFAPRGTGETLPFSCYATEEARSSAWQRVAGGYAEGRAQNWVNTKQLADDCAATQNKTGELIGTAFVARDVMQIVDALKEDGMLRYLGFSYGTLLGATLAAMFPERIEKLLLDSVVNPFEYYNNRDIESFMDADKAFYAFCSQCVLAPDSCPLAGNLTAIELKLELTSFFQDLKLHPVVVGTEAFTYLDVKGYFQQSLKSPSIWQAVSQILYILKSRDDTLLQAIVGLKSQISSSFSVEVTYGIQCSDTVAHTTEINDLIPVMDEVDEVSWLSGDIREANILQCEHWKMRAKERYEGDFKVKTKNPIMLIGLPYDPVTPLKSAQNVSATFEGSVLLQQDSVGHTILEMGSLCTAQAISAYFNNGTLPQNGTVCECDAPPFANATNSGWEVVVKEFGLDTLIASA